MIGALFLGARWMIGLFEPERIERQSSRRAAPESLREVIEFARDAYFQDTSHPTLNSLEYSGTFRLEGALVPFQAFKKSGPKYRLQLRTGDREERFIYAGSGSTVVHQRELLDAVEQIPVSAAEANDFIRDAPMHFPFLWSDDPGSEFAYDGIVQRYGLPYLSIRRLSDASVSEVFLLSPETGLVQYREMRGNADEPLRSVSEYGEYREVSGIQFPHRVISWSNYRYRADTFIAKVEVNQGILDRYFE
jgi:hypothetical protein